jgi:hypothetical protein
VLVRGGTNRIYLLDTIEPILVGLLAILEGRIIVVRRELDSSVDTAYLYPFPTLFVSGTNSPVTLINFERHENKDEFGTTEKLKLCAWKYWLRSTALDNIVGFFQCIKLRVSKQYSVCTDLRCRVV